MGSIRDLKSIIKRNNMKTPPTEKKCSKCGEVKRLDEFSKDARKKDGKQYQCKACNKAYKQENKEKVCERQKAYRSQPHVKEKISERNKAYHAQPRVKERRNKRHRERYKNDPQYKAAYILRGMLRRVLNGEAKTESALELVGCTTEKLWEHIEKSFVDGMTVQNHGEVWHIGHIEPLSGFDPTNDEHVKRVNHFSNLKAQFKEENLSDGAKVPDNHQAGLPLRYD